MIPLLVFPLVAAFLIYQAGRRDAARDPRLTISLLILLAALPLMSAFLPKIDVFRAPTEAPAPEGTFSWGSMIVAVWSVGFLIQLARIVAALISLERWKNESTEVAQEAGVSIRESARVSGPVAAGIRRPVIFVPHDWKTWGDESRRVVIEHELAHHRRRDPLWRLLATFARSVHWYHPLVHWMSKRFVEQCEFACDAIVLKNGVSSKAYARVLCEFAGAKSPSPLAAAMAEQSSLECRVLRILQPATEKRNSALAALGLMGLLAACSLSMIGQKQNRLDPVPAKEIELRLTADPFPGNP